MMVNDQTRMIAVGIVESLFLPELCGFFKSRIVLLLEGLSTKAEVSI